MNPDVQRLGQLLELVAREERHLLAVRERLLGDCNATTITADWLAARLNDADGIDRLESFYAKFSRMQDTVVDKLLPALLTAAGESPGSAIDNLERASRLRLLGDPDEWIGMRRLRNRLVHEYVQAAEDRLVALQQALLFVDKLSAAYRATRNYATARFTLAGNSSAAGSSGPVRGGWRSTRMQACDSGRGYPSAARDRTRTWPSAVKQHLRHRLRAERSNAALGCLWIPEICLRLQLQIPEQIREPLLYSLFPRLELVLARARTGIAGNGLAALYRPTQTPNQAEERVMVQLREAGYLA